MKVATLEDVLTINQVYRLRDSQSYRMINESKDIAQLTVLDLWHLWGIMAPDNLPSGLTSGQFLQVECLHWLLKAVVEKNLALKQP